MLQLLLPCFTTTTGKLFGENTEVRGLSDYLDHSSPEDVFPAVGWQVSQVKNLSRHAAVGLEQFDEAVLFWQSLGSKRKSEKLSSAVVTFQCGGGAAEAWGSGWRAAVVRLLATSCVRWPEHTAVGVKHQCCLMQVPIVWMSEPIKALPSTNVDSRPCGVMNLDGGGAAVYLFAVSPVQALTSSHPFLTSLYMFLTLLGGSTLMLQRIPANLAASWCSKWCKAVSSLFSLPSAELQRHW